MIKTLNKLGIKRTSSIWLRAFMETNKQTNPTTNINSERLKELRLRSGTTTTMPAFTASIQNCIRNIVLKVITWAVCQEKGNKRHPNWKETSKTIPLCRWHDHIWKIKNIHTHTHTHTKKTIRANKFSETAG